ncbi:MAG: gliding motility-associated C-terminal domain-containing protein [Bacteroidetes bacterium]|nr:gliding motility-associated C-terminal domain-containing protein [Bacteroidota bacterium]
MKKLKHILSFSLLVFLIATTNSAFSQISFTIVKVDVACNNSSLGEIEINVTPTNPPYTYVWNTGQSSHLIDNLSVGNYSVTITDDLGNDTIISISIIENECEMIPAIAFTPNGDGINDTWFIQNYQFFSNASVQVFDRLGALVFEQQGLYEAWDGKSLLGTPLPDASYYFIVFKDKSDKSAIKKGTVSIVK